MDDRARRYAESLARLIRTETVSGPETSGDGKFHAFREQLKETFPALFSRAEYTEFTDGFVLRWEGRDASARPDLFMNHHDVVEAAGEWRYGPFSGEIEDGRVWGRGTLDDKGGLWAMLQAAEELVREEYVPRRTIWFSSSSTEESTGRGAEEISKWFEQQGISFRLCLDEGGFILPDPMRGVKGNFAVIGVGEKGCADLKFTARSRGGHASMPPKNSPLVRLGRFMAEADRQRIFDARLSPPVCEMLRRLAPFMKGRKADVMARPERFSHALTAALLSAPVSASLLRTTVAFTMAGGSEGANVLPAEAWVVANMRYSHHQGREKSFAAIRELAEKYDLEMEVLDPGIPSGITDYTGDGFALAERAVKAALPDVKAAVPYLLSGASDARFFDRISDQTLRFLPFHADDGQLASIHGIDESADIADLAPAVDFYRFMMKEEITE